MNFPFFAARSILALLVAVPLRASGGELAGSSSLSGTQAALVSLAQKGEGTTFGRGECWDFVAATLDAAKCQWKRPLDFGRPLDLGRESIQPGDILQFESVKLEWRAGNRFGTVHLGFQGHYAIVLSASGSVVEMAHQNYNRIRQVSFLTIDLKGVTAGKVTAFRPRGAETAETAGAKKQSPR